MKKPIASIIIPVHNRPKLLAQTILTARQHTALPLEFVVIDDHSTDPVFESIPNLARATLRYYRLPRQVGPGTALTYGAALANPQSPYLIFNGADAYFEKNWLERLLSVTKKASRYGITSGALQGSSDLDTPPFNTPLTLHPIDRLGLSIMVTRRIWQDFGPFPPHRLGVPSEDVHFSETVSKAGYSIGFTKPGVIIHTGITSSFWDRNQVVEDMVRIRARRPEIYME